MNARQQCSCTIDSKEMEPRRSHEACCPKRILSVPLAAGMYRSDASPPPRFLPRPCIVFGSLGYTNAKRYHDRKQVVGHEDGSGNTWNIAVKQHSIRLPLLSTHSTSIH
jgi:hypothetical protein